MVDSWFAKGLIFCCCEVEFSYFCDPCTAPKPGAYARRLARVVEEARLESVYTGNRIEGSNPSVSAVLNLKNLSIKTVKRMPSPLLLLIVPVYCRDATS